jgi:hypothetical protein
MSRVRTFLVTVVEVEPDALDLTHQAPVPLSLRPGEGWFAAADRRRRERERREFLARLQREAVSDGVEP